MSPPEFVIVARDAESAQSLATILPCGTDPLIALVGADPESARRLSVSRVVVLLGVSYATPPHALGPLLRPLLSGVVVLDSTQPSRDLAGWAVMTLDAPVVWAVDAMRVTPDGLELDRVLLGGSHRLVHRIDDAKAAIVLAKPSATEPEGVTKREPVVDVIAADLSVSRTRIVETRRADESLVPLSAARVIVSVGRGVGGPENIPIFRELAARLGAGFGATRVVVDAGWVPFAHQVGQTGAAVAPELYLAFGISGAIQHLAGMHRSRCVVAINTDADAPLCRIADLVVKADAVKVAETLLDRLGGGAA